MDCEGLLPRLLQLFPVVQAERDTIALGEMKHADGNSGLVSCT